MNARHKLEALLCSLKSEKTSLKSKETKKAYALALLFVTKDLECTDEHLLLVEARKSIEVLRMTSNSPVYQDACRVLAKRIEDAIN